MERAPLPLRGRLARFTDVLIPDGCAFKLANALSGVYKGTGQPAEFKLHAIYSVGHGSLTRLASSAGSVHDSDGLPDGPWESGALYLWDLAYNDYCRFIRAARAGAHLLQRLKERANPIALASYGVTGHRRALARDDGTPVRLDEACALGMVHQRTVLDLDVQIRATGLAPYVARAVCVPCDGDDHWYLTTLPREIFSPQDVAELYRVRWEVELYFRHWRGAVRLDEVRRLRDPAALEVAVLSSLLASLLSHEIHDALERVAAELPPSSPPPPPPALDVAFSPRTVVVSTRGAPVAVTRPSRRFRAHRAG